MNGKDLYLDLMIRSLTQIGTLEPGTEAYERRFEGHDWPKKADTMIGVRRLLNIKECMEEIIRVNVTGDVIETGVWKGGATIFMRAVLKAYGDKKRKVWVADSFEGLPKPDPKKYPRDSKDKHWKQDQLAISLDSVKKNFQKYNLADEQVCFLPGWFEDTLPEAPIEKLSLLRLDGDMYSSTIQALEALYHKLSFGGYCIIDDFSAAQGCRDAVNDYRQEHKIKDVMYQIGGVNSAGSVFWRKHKSK